MQTGKEEDVHSMTHPATEPIAWPVLPSDTPIIYEDEEEGDMGEVNRHASTNVIIFVCLRSFLRDRHPGMRVFLNMNCYYADGPKHKRTGSRPYFSSDNMIVEPSEPLSEDTRSYTIGQSGPPPLLVIETLSEGTAEENDLDVKVKLYSRLKVPEYIIVDVTGELLPEKLLLKRLRPDGTWKDERDADGGVTSHLGFRLLIDENGELVVMDASTGRRYIRPQDAEDLISELEEKAHVEQRARKSAERKARETEKKAKEAEEKIVALQAELERLRRGAK
jgi:Uma2 family endonuclease